MTSEASEDLVQEACHRLRIVLHSRGYFIQACLEHLAKRWFSVQVTYDRGNWSILCFDGELHRLRGASDDLATALASAVMSQGEEEMSEEPTSSPCSGGEDDDWRPSDRVCEQCGKLVWEAGWFDDQISNGGACIGTLYMCGDCGWEDSE